MAYYVGKQFVGGGFAGEAGTKPIDNAWAGGQLLDAQCGEDIRDGFLPYRLLADFLHGGISRGLMPSHDFTIRDYGLDGFVAPPK